MKVAELKQVVDANAVEMREGFAKVREEISHFRTEMREGFARMDRRFDQQSEELHAVLAAAKVRLEREFRKR